MMCASLLVNRTTVLSMRYPDHMVRINGQATSRTPGYDYCVPNADAVEFGGFVYTIFKGKLYVFSLSNLSFFTAQPSAYLSVSKSFDGHFLILEEPQHRFRFVSHTLNYTVEPPPEYYHVAGYFVRIDSFMQLFVLTYSERDWCRRRISLQKYKFAIYDTAMRYLRFDAVEGLLVIKSFASIQVNITSGMIKALINSDDYKMYQFDGRLYVYNTIDQRVSMGQMDHIYYGPQPEVFCQRRSQRKFYCYIAVAMSMLAYAVLVSTL